MGAAMGWSADEVDRTSMWKFFAAWAGFIEANSPASKTKLTSAEKAELWADVEAYGLQPSQAISTQTYRLEGAELVPSGVVSFRPG